MAKLTQLESAFGAACDERDRLQDINADLLAALEATLRSLEAHLDESCRDNGLSHRDELCPCNKNEVVLARAAIAKAKAGKE